MQNLADRVQVLPLLSLGVNFKVWASAQVGVWGFRTCTAADLTADQPITSGATNLKEANKASDSIDASPGYTPGRLAHEG